MPTAHYIPLSALKENGLHPSSSHPNVTTETALRLDGNVPRSNPQLASNNCGNNPRTMDVTKDGNSNLNVKNSQNEKKNCRVRFIDRVEALREYKEKNGHLVFGKEMTRAYINGAQTLEVLEKILSHVLVM